MLANLANLAKGGVQDILISVNPINKTYIRVILFGGKSAKTAKNLLTPKTLHMGVVCR